PVALFRWGPIVLLPLFRSGPIVLLPLFRWPQNNDPLRGDGSRPAELRLFASAKVRQQSSSSVFTISPPPQCSPAALLLSVHHQPSSSVFTISPPPQCSPSALLLSVHQQPSSSVFTISPPPQCSPSALLSGHQQPLSVHQQQPKFTT
ncbi:hypothetical protein NHX12_029717, partial [Muraenolepis orangiensis]